MVKSIQLLVILLLANVQLFAQSSSNMVLVRNAGIVKQKQTISIKWYSKDIYYSEGVNLYRREGSSGWIRLNTAPIKKMSDLPKSEYDKDQDLYYYIPLINQKKGNELEKIMLISVLQKTFYSEAFSKFLGIQFDDTLAVEGKSYQYKVYKVKGSGEELIGESKAIIAGAETIEETLKEIQVKADTNKVLFKWKHEPIRFYSVNIYREEKSGQWTLLKYCPVVIAAQKDSLGRLTYPEVFHKEDSLKPGFYTYQLAGTDFFGKETKRSESFTVQIKDLIPPPAPENLEDSIKNLTVHLSWLGKKSDDITGYHIYRGSKSDGPFIRLTTIPLASNVYNFIDQVEKAGPYYYYVSSIDAAGNESNSEMKFSEVHDIVPPIKPMGLIAKADTGKIYLSWNANKEQDLMGYLIYRKINKNAKDHFVLLNANAIKENTFCDRLPDNAKNKFIYKVIAIDSAFNKSEASDIAMAQMPDIYPPVQPLLLKVVNEGNYIRLEWLENKDGDLKGYNIYKSNKNGGFSKLNHTVISFENNKYLDMEIESAISYYYHITAIDSAGNESIPSNIIKGINLNSSPTIAVSHLKAKFKKGKNEVLLSWKSEKTESIVGYYIYRRNNDDETFKPVSGMLLNEQNQFVDKDINAGKTYYYQVSILDKSGKILKSEIIKVNAP